MLRCLVHTGRLQCAVFTPFHAYVPSRARIHSSSRRTQSPGAVPQVSGEPALDTCCPCCVLFGSCKFNGRCSHARRLGTGTCSPPLFVTRRGRGHGSDLGTPDARKDHVRSSKNKSWTVRFGVPQGKYRKVEVEEDEEGLRAIERLAEMFGSLASRHVVFVESASCNCSTIVRRLSLFRCNRLKLERASSRARVLEAWFWLHTTTPPTPIAVSRLHIRPGQDPHIFSDLVVQGMLLLLTDIGLLTSCQCACIFCARQVGCRGFALAKTAGPEPRPAIVRNFRAARQSQSGILRLAKVNDHDAWVQMDRIADGKSLSCQQDCSRLSGLQGFVLGAKEYFSCFFSVGGWCT